MSKRPDKSEKPDNSENHHDKPEKSGKPENSGMSESCYGSKNSESTENPDNIDNPLSERDSDDVKKFIEDLFNKTNESGVRFVVQNIEDIDIVKVKTMPVYHGVFLTMLFRNSRFSRSFAKWVLPMILSPKSMALMAPMQAQVYVVKFFDQNTFHEFAVDTILVIPSLSGEFYFFIKLLMEFKSYRDDEEPLQSSIYVLQMYRDELAKYHDTNKEHPSGNVRRKPQLTPCVRVHLCNAKTEDMGVVNFDEYFAYLPETIQNDLRPYTHYPDEVPLNLASMPYEDLPIDEEVPELYAGLCAAKAINEKDINELLDRIFDYLINTQHQFNSPKEYLEFTQLLLQYNDHYAKNLEENKLDRLCDRVIQTTGDNNMPDLFIKKYREGYQDCAKDIQKEIEKANQRADQATQRADQATQDAEFLLHSFRGIIIKCLKDNFPGQDTSRCAKLLNQITSSEAILEMYSSLPGIQSLAEYEAKAKGYLPK